MSNKKDDRINLFDYIGFPDRQQRDEAQQICNIEKLHLLPVENSDLLFFDTYFEQYNVWGNHISNFSSHLWLRFLLMYYHFINYPSDTVTLEESHSPKMAHKIFFDTFSEDVSLYLISYFDKHLEMFNNLYDFKRLYKKRHNLSRKTIIKEMKNTGELQELVKSYEDVEKSPPFSQVKSIRDNFVHNKSSSHFGRDVVRFAGEGYASVHSQGISTDETYNSVCELLVSYEQLCEKVNIFMRTKAEKPEQEKA